MRVEKVLSRHFVRRNWRVIVAECDGAPWAFHALDDTGAGWGFETHYAVHLGPNRAERRRAKRRKHRGASLLGRARFTLRHASGWRGAGGRGFNNVAHVRYTRMRNAELG